MNAAQVLGCVGEPAVPSLETLLSSPNDMTRLLAVSTLGEIGLDDVRLRSRFEAMMCDSSPMIRLTAAEALGRFGEDPDHFVPFVLLTYQTGDTASRQRAIGILAGLRSRAASAIPVLTNAVATATNADEKSQIVYALKAIDPAKFGRDPTINPSGLYPDIQSR